MKRNTKSDILCDKNYINQIENKILQNNGEWLTVLSSMDWNISFSILKYITEAMRGDKNNNAKKDKIKNVSPVGHTQ